VASPSTRRESRGPQYLLGLSCFAIARAGRGLLSFLYQAATELRPNRACELRRVCRRGSSIQDVAKVNFCACGFRRAEDVCGRACWRDFQCAAGRSAGRRPGLRTEAPGFWARVSSSTCWVAAGWVIPSSANAADFGAFKFQLREGTVGHTGFAGRLGGLLCTRDVSSYAYTVQPAGQGVEERLLHVQSRFSGLFPRIRGNRLPR